MRVRQSSPTRLILTERHEGSLMLSWALLAGVLISGRISYSYASISAGIVSALCAIGLVVGWRWGAWRTVRVVRGGNIRLRDHRGLRWEYPVSDIDEIEVSGSPEEHGGADYRVVLFVRGAGWVPLSPANLLRRDEAVAISNRIRAVLEWPEVRTDAAPVQAAAGR